MSDADNPYRFVEALEQEESADGPPPGAGGLFADWDLRAYVAPKEEPILSPGEIADLGHRWSGLALAAVLDLVISGVVAFLLSVVTIAPAVDGSAIFLLCYALLAFIGFRMLLWFDAWLLLRTLRYPPRRSALAALLCTLPVANFSLLIPLKKEATAMLRRHGISAGWRTRADSLPRRIERPTERRR